MSISQLNRKHWLSLLISVWVFIFYHLSTYATWSTILQISLSSSEFSKCCVASKHPHYCVSNLSGKCSSLFEKLSIPFREWSVCIIKNISNFCVNAETRSWGHFTLLSVDAYYATLIMIWSIGRWFFISTLFILAGWMLVTRILCHLLSVRVLQKAAWPKDTLPAP